MTGSTTRAISRNSSTSCVNAGALRAAAINAARFTMTRIRAATPRLRKSGRVSGAFWLRIGTDESLQDSTRAQFGARIGGLQRRVAPFAELPRGPPEQTDTLAFAGDSRIAPALYQAAMSAPEEKDHTWSGRFSEPVAERVQRYTASVIFDRRLAEFDLRGSLAHARMLAACRILSASDLADIERGLDTIRG